MLRRSHYSRRTPFGLSDRNLVDRQQVNSVENRKEDNFVTFLNEKNWRKCFEPQSDRYVIKCISFIAFIKNKGDLDAKARK